MFLLTLTVFFWALFPVRANGSDIKHVLILNSFHPEYNWTENTIVLLLHHFKDKTGETQPVEIGTPALASRCPVPCFVVADVRGGFGALGGYVVSGYHYGKAAAGMVVQILSGTPVEKIPLGIGPNQDMFDYNALERFGINEKDIPAGSVVINRPGSVFKQYQHEIFIMGAAITILCLLLVVMFFEILRRRRIEVFLAESEERLRLTTDNLPGSYVYQYTYTAEGKLQFLFVSKGVEKVHPGVKAEDILKDPAILRNLIDPDQLQELMEAEAASARQQTDFSMELRFRWPDGQQRWLYASSRTRKNELGQVLWDGAAIDITDRKSSEQALNETKEMFALFMKHTPVYTYIKDVTPNTSLVLQASDNYVDMINISGRDMIGKTMEELFPPEFSRKITADDWDVVTRGKVLKLDEELNGRFYTTIKFPISLGNRTLLGGYTIDITDRKRSEEILLEQKRFYENIVENIQTGVWVSDKEDVLRYFNRQMENISGVKSEQAIGLRVLEDLSEETIKHFRSIYIKAKETLQPIEYSAIHVVTPAGRETIQSGWVIPLVLNNEFNGIICTVEDITGRIQAELKLDESEQEYRLLFETMAQGVVYHSADGRIISANPSAEKILGLTLDQMVGHTSKDSLWRTIHEDGSPFPGETHPAMVALRTGVSVSNVVMGINNPETDEIRWIIINAIPQFRSAETKPYQVYATFSDITERKQTEEALRLSHHRYQQLVDNAKDGIFTLSPDGRFDFVNAGICDMLGYAPEELIGRHIFETYPEEKIKEGETRLSHIEKGQTVQISRPMVRKDGSFVMVEANAWKTADGHFQAFVRDITDRIRAEEEKERLHEQLIQSQKMESVGRLAGGVAHDFNNMLGVILGNAEIALDKIEPSHPIFNELVEISKAGERSANLTRQLLAFARKQTVSPRLLDLNETVEGMLKMLRRLIGEDIDLAWMPDGHIGKIKVDPSQIDQIMINLCINARDAISGVGRITIETGPAVFDEAYCAGHVGFLPGEFVFLSLTDTGCGMDKEMLSRMFEPFFTTKEMGKGTGLGLAMVYGIVGQNNGFIDVESEKGKGTTFRIYFPKVLDSLPLSAPDTEEPVERGHETILMVEDEQAILKMATKMLHLQGYKVLSAETPVEAIRLAEENAGLIDLLMVDVIMPEMNGRDLAQKLQSLIPGLKCLFMSGYTADVIAHHGVLDERVSFIQKPFSVKDLAKKIRETLSGKPENNCDGLNSGAPR